VALNAFFNNLSGFLKLFIPLFLFFSLVGAVTGYGMRDEVVTEALLKNFLIKEDNNVYVMEFTCAENNLGYIHSIDTNKITPLGNLSAQIDYRSTALEFPTDRYSKYRTLVSSILGGTTGGFQLSSALKKPPADGLERLYEKPSLASLALSADFQPDIGPVHTTTPIATQRSRSKYSMTRKPASTSNRLDCAYNC
jgi:hypothetical protein